jgi:hypothetical protein
VDGEDALLLLLELRDRLYDVSAEHRRVVPLRVLERRRDDVLRHVVEPVGELALALRPGVGEAPPGDPAEQQRVRLERLVELELVALLAAADLEAPAGVLVVLRPARVLDYAVERHEFGYDDLCHVVLLAQAWGR